MIVKLFGRGLWVLMAVALMGVPVAVRAEMVSPAKEIAGYQVVGKSHYTKFGISVFDAVLSAPGGNYRPDGDFALALTYSLSLKGVRIAGQARKEMALQGKPEAQLDVWQKQLEQLIPDVVKGDVLTGIHDSSGHMLLLKNGIKVGRVDDVALSTAFFNIWLGTKVSDPGQRDALLSKK